MRPPALPREALELDKLADLAQGGMGSVEIGVVRTGRLAGRVLAIKRLHEELAGDEAVVSMFLDEAWLTSQIQSPNVARVEAFGEDARGLFLASELVRGVSLGRLLAESRARSEPFPERTVAFIASQTCAGLSAAHELRDAEGKPLGLVHRDLTPGNILIGFDGIVKIADFGIAKAERRVSAETRMGVLKGKPSYVSPEQVRGGRLDGRADLFALGIVLFELLAGRRPWRGKDDTEVLIAMMRTEPPRLAELRPNISPPLAQLVDACLRKRPEDRPQSAADVRLLLDAFRAERGFERDDQASLAEFVGRNAAAIAAWFDQALAGQMTTGGPSLEQAEKEIAQTRVVDAPPPSEETTSDAATGYYRHDAPPPGAAAMIEAMAPPDSVATVTMRQDDAPTGRAPERPGLQGGTYRMDGSPADALARLPLSTPVFGASNALMPGRGLAAPASAGGGARGLPQATEWLSAPPSSPRAASGAPPSSSSRGSSPVSSSASAASEVSVFTSPPRTLREGPPRGGALRIVLVFVVVFLLTVAAVGAMLRFGVVQIR